MGPVKRAFPFVVWLVAFLLLLAVFLPGLWLLWEAAVPAASMPDFSLLLRTDILNGLIPELETALHATFLCLALGYPVGCLLALYKRRTAFVSCLMPVFFLGGAVLLFGQRLIHLFPYGLASAFLTAVDGTVSPFVAMSMILLPPMILCTCSFTAAVDPALANAARSLGASRLRAFLTLTFPRTLRGAMAGSIFVFVPAVGLSLISRQTPGTTFASAAPISAAILFLTLMILIIHLLVLKKTRRVSPC